MIFLRGHGATQFEILERLSLEAVSYLEVGVQEGKSLAVVLASPEVRDVTLCDTWGKDSGGTSRGSHAHVPVRDGCKIEFLDEDSRQALPKVQGRKFDLVHIDGGHDYDVVKSDLREGWRLCGGVMVVHDISFVGVWRAFFEFTQTLIALSVKIDCYFGGNGTAVVQRVA